VRAVLPPWLKARLHAGWGSGKGAHGVMSEKGKHKGEEGACFVSYARILTILLLLGVQS